MEINLSVLLNYILGFGFASIVSFCLGLFLINRGDWWEAKRTTDFGLMNVYSEWDLFWIRCKIFIINFSGRLMLGVAAVTGVFCAIGIFVYANTTVVE